MALDNQQLALMRLMLAQQQAPQVQIAPVQDVGSGIAVGVQNLTNALLQRRQQETNRQLLDALMHREQATNADAEDTLFRALRGVGFSNEQAEAAVASGDPAFMRDLAKRVNEVNDGLEEDKEFEDANNLDLTDPRNQNIARRAFGFDPNTPVTAATEQLDLQNLSRETMFKNAIGQANLNILDGTTPENRVGSALLGLPLLESGASGTAPNFAGLVGDKKTSILPANQALEGIQAIPNRPLPPAGPSILDSAINQIGGAFNSASNFLQQPQAVQQQQATQAGQQLRQNYDDVVRALQGFGQGTISNADALRRGTVNFFGGLSR